MSVSQPNRSSLSRTNPESLSNTNGEYPRSTEMRSILNLQEPSWCQMKLLKCRPSSLQSSAKSIKSWSLFSPRISSTTSKILSASSLQVPAWPWLTTTRANSHWCNSHLRQANAFKLSVQEQMVWFQSALKTLTLELSRLDTLRHYLLLSPTSLIATCTSSLRWCRPIKLAMTRARRPLKCRESWTIASSLTTIRESSTPNQRRRSTSRSSPI